MKVKSESEVAQSCPTLSDPMDCSLPGSSVHGIFQARVLEWAAIAFSDKDGRDVQILKHYPPPPPPPPPPRPLGLVRVITGVGSPLSGLRRGEATGGVQKGRAA